MRLRGGAGPGDQCEVGAFRPKLLAMLRPSSFDAPVINTWKAGILRRAVIVLGCGDFHRLQFGFGFNVRFTWSGSRAMSVR
jgi:hypothetical protein